MSMDRAAASLIGHLATLLDRSLPKALCESCMAMIVGDAAHVCDPEERAQAMTRAGLGGLLGLRSAKQRAKGYAIT